jgi:hypothetical protein
MKGRLVRQRLSKRPKIEKSSSLEGRSVPKDEL